MRIKFDARNIYKTVPRLCEFRKTLYSEIRYLLGGRIQVFISVFPNFSSDLDCKFNVNALHLMQLKILEFP